MARHKATLLLGLMAALLPGLMTDAEAFFWGSSKKASTGAAIQKWQDKRLKYSSGCSNDSFTLFNEVDANKHFGHTYLVDFVLSDLLLAHGWCPPERGALADIDRVFFLVMSNTESARRVKTLKRTWLGPWTRHWLATGGQDVPDLIVGPEGPDHARPGNEELSNILQSETSGAR